MLDKLTAGWLFFHTIHTVTYSGVIHISSGSQHDQLIDQVHFLANKIHNSRTANNQKPVIETTTKAGPHIPGWTNICVNLCPKWCRKSTTNHGNYTDCHYVCGNICNATSREINPFLGNQTYEVVPSSYDFTNYDHNKDKLLSLQEIARTEQVTPGDIKHLFTFADFNKDGFIDQEEFMGGPFVFTVQMAAELTVVAKSTPIQDTKPDSDSD